MDTKASARHRNRASTACTGCRKARIRCILTTSQTICSNCRDNDFECVFDEKDGRKCRTTAKDINEALSKRLQQLEELLKEKTDAPGENEAQRAAAVNSTAIDMLPGAGEPPPPYNAPTDEIGSPPGESSSATEKEPGGEQPSSVVRRVIPSPILFDLASGRIRYFGPTTNISVLSARDLNKSPGLKQTTHWPIGLLIRDLSPESHNYLMDLFWACHNAVVHLIHLDAFYLDQDQGGTSFYSTFLHLTMLATGFRYADKSRPDIKKLISSGTCSSTLHEKAKAMAMVEIDHYSGLTSIQGFSLLGELEFYHGRDETGWMFTGIAFRMLLDAGLHVDPASLHLTEREIQIRHMVLWSSLIVDKFWSLYLGRPTTLKSADIAPSCLTFDFTRLLSCRPAGHEKKIGTRIYEALLHLMEIAGPLCSVREPPTTNNADAHFKMAAMDHELKSWRSRLPEYLKWPSEKQALMPASYYLLHAQYHAALILLYRPFIQYRNDAKGAETDETDIKYHFTSLSRSACAENAKCIAKLFQQYQARFDLAQVYGTGVQHAGTAATALMGEIVLQADAGARKNLAEHLYQLQKSIRLMSRNYQPAVLMAAVVDEFLAGMQERDEIELPGGGVASPADKDVASSSSYAGGIGQGEASTWMAELGNSHARPRKRARVDGAHCFSATSSGAQSPQGLPLWSSSFLETLGEEDTAFSILNGTRIDTEFGLPWDNTWHP